MPHVFVVYDIPNDKIRSKVSNSLKDYGLRRIQKSVFEGDLSYNRAEELSYVIDRILGDEEGDVRIIFVPPSFVDKVIIVREMYVVEDETIVVG